MENTLLHAHAILPTYHRDALVARIVHLGFGAFHRAHQAFTPIFLPQSTAVTGAIVKLT
ncbi:Putative D-mannonate oxidoreductase [Cronobacter sakazakii 680]|nr:Putative D-mannonate oxidoreductase [Cronobacter sakazakii 680]